MVLIPPACEMPQLSPITILGFLRTSATALTKESFTDEQIQYAIYGPIPGELQEGGNYLNPNDYEWDQTPESV